MSNLTPREKGNAAASVLGTWFADERSRVRYGQAARSAMVKRLRGGMDAEGYRAAWISETARGLFAILKNHEDKFNDMYCWDRLSPADLLDVLATAHGMINGQVDTDADDIAMFMGDE